MAVHGARGVAVGVTCDDSSVIRAGRKRFEMLPGSEMVIATKRMLVLISARLMMRRPVSILLHDETVAAPTQHIINTMIIVSQEIVGVRHHRRCDRRFVSKRRAIGPSGKFTENISRLDNAS